MNTAELTELESQIGTLIDKLSRLQTDNHALRQQLAQSAQERARLQAKSQTAANKVRLIISQLKEQIS